MSEVIAYLITAGADPNAMDTRRLVDGMIARGPLLAADRSTWTGSMHIVELPSAEAADEFVQRQPYNRAGLFAEHLILRFQMQSARAQMCSRRTRRTHGTIGALFCGRNREPTRSPTAEEQSDERH